MTNNKVDGSTARRIESKASFGGLVASIRGTAIEAKKAQKAITEQWKFLERYGDPPELSEVMARMRGKHANDLSVREIDGLTRQILEDYRVWQPNQENEQPPLTDLINRLPDKVEYNDRQNRIAPAAVANIDRADRRVGRLYQPHDAGKNLTLLEWARMDDDEAPYHHPRLPLHLHRLGLDRQHGQGFPLPGRIWVEGLLGATHQSVYQPEQYSVPFRTFMQRIYPNGRVRPKDMLPKIEASAKTLGDPEARIWWENPDTGQGGRRQVVAVTDIPRTPEHLDDLITVTVSLPPGSRAGPIMPQNLMAWMARSHVAGVGLINLAYQWFDPGYLRLPVKGGHWLQIKKPERYPDLTADDLLMLFSPHTEWRKGGTVRRDTLHHIRETIRKLLAANGFEQAIGSQPGTIKLLPKPNEPLEPPGKREVKSRRKPPPLPGLFD